MKLRLVLNWGFWRAFGRYCCIRHEFFYLFLESNLLLVIIQIRQLTNVASFFPLFIDIHTGCIGFDKTVFLGLGRTIFLDLVSAY